MRATIVKGKDGDLVVYTMRVGYWSTKVYG